MSSAAKNKKQTKKRNNSTVSHTGICTYVKNSSTVNKAGILWAFLPVPLSNPQVLELTAGCRRGVYACGGGESSVLVFVLWVGRCGGILLGAGLLRSVSLLWCEYYLMSVICLSFSFLFYWVSRAGGYDRLLGLALPPSHSSHTGPPHTAHTCSCPQAFALLLSACFFLFFKHFYYERFLNTHKSREIV